MKKSAVLLSILCFITFLAACDSSKESLPNTATSAEEITTSVSAVTETDSITTTVNTRVETLTSQETTFVNPSDEEMMLNESEHFLNSIKNKDIEELCLITGVKSPEAYSFFNKIQVDSFEILEKMIMGNNWNLYTVQLNISQSDVERFPVGSSKWLLEVALDDAGPIMLFSPIDAKPEKITWIESSEMARFCYAFTNSFPLYKTITDFNVIVPSFEDAVEFKYFCEEAIIFMPYSNNVVTKNETSREYIDRTLKSVLNITGVDLKKCSFYNPADDSLLMDGRGGYWKYCSLYSEEFDAQTNQYTVVIDYYADRALLAKAKTMKYLVQYNEGKTYTLLSTELLFDSGWEVASGCI